MNVGGLSFTYGLETDDIVGSGFVFNAHDASWITFVRGLFNACQTMYRNRESAGCFNSKNFLAKVKAWQDTRPERVWVADAQRKYLRPYEDNGTVTYIPMLAGRKTHQREQVKTYNEYYYASKYVSNLCTTQNIMVRGNTPTTWTGVAPANTATLSMYIDCYIVVASTSYNVVAKRRAKRGQSYVMDFSTIGPMGETELYFCTAPMIIELSGLAHLYFKQNNFAMGTNLQRLEVGSSVAGYTNLNLESLTIGNNRMLEYLDVRNCPNATGALDLSGCLSLSELYLENTSFTGITFATGGLLRIAHLPSPTSITMRELIYLEDLLLESTNNLSTIREEDCVFDDATTLTIGSTVTTQAQSDIVLTLIGASPNLSRVRLVGVDWTLPNTDLLNRLVEMAGIDSDSYDIGQSVIVGEAFTPTMRQSALTRYNEAWPYLIITYNSIVTQYAATFMNADGNPILDKSGNAYVQWVDAGSVPYDPITMGYIITISGNGTPDANGYVANQYTSQHYLDVQNGIVYVSNGSSWVVEAISDVLTPTMEDTAQYIYTFSSWENISGAMSAARTITAKYSTVTRTYSVTWYPYPGGSALETQSNISYGTSVSYSGVNPDWLDGESTFVYRIFNGWDKSTGHVSEDLDVYAKWETAYALPATGTDMKNMSVAEIYGIGKAGMQDAYWSVGDTVEVEMGHDFDFSNVNDVMIGEDYLLNGIEVDEDDPRVHYFDGEHAYTTNIKLLDTDSPAFTMAIDFQFADTSNADINLVSCNEGSTTNGFRLYFNGNRPTIQWGDQTVSVGYQKYRDIVVLRHPKGSRYLYVYASSSANTSSTFEDSVTKTNLYRSAFSAISEPLSFGAVRYGTGFRGYGKGVIHWCKIWYDDLGEENAIKLATWPHEKLQMKYWGAGKYYYYNTNETANASWICTSILGGINTTRNHLIGSTYNSNTGGWAESAMRSFVNGKVFDGFPVRWQSIIRPVEIKSGIGNSSTTVSVSENRIYVPCLREVYSTTGAVYMAEVGTSTDIIPWFTSSQGTMMWRGFGRDYGNDVTVYSCPNDPSAYYQTDIAPYSIWVNTNNYSYRYLFVPQDIIDHYGIVPAYTADAEFAQGGWVRSDSWWTRSPYSNSSSSWVYMSYSGSYGGTSGSSYGIVIGFSI